MGYIIRIRKNRGKCIKIKITCKDGKLNGENNFTEQHFYSKKNIMVYNGLISEALQ